MFMYKYYASDSGKEVKVGDVLTLTASDHPASLTMNIQDEGDLEILFKHDVLIRKEEKPKQQSKPISVTYERAIERIADRVGWKKEKVKGYIDNLRVINPVAALNVVLRELAMEFDRKYPDHISECDKIWVFEVTHGTVKTLKNNNVHPLYFSGFAAFRTFLELVEALEVCDPILGQIYGVK